MRSLTYAQLATTLQFEHAKAEEHEDTLEIIPLHFQPKTVLYSAASRLFYSGIILSAAAELMAPKYALRFVRASHLVCATSIPMVIRLMLLARRLGVYEEYMQYPDKRYVRAQRLKGCLLMLPI